MPPAPAHRVYIPDLPPTYRTTTNGDPFLVYDSGVGDKERILIFASQNALQLLADSEHWYADGTFKICLEIFFQLYTIHGQCDGRIFLCVLSQRYNQEEEFALHIIRMLPALAFLPASDVIEGFEELVDTIRVLYNDVADDLLQYFEDTYIGRYRRNAPRRPPLCAINLWNMFNRTDNSLEGWHRSFQGHVSACHPVFLKLLSLL